MGLVVVVGVVVRDDAVAVCKLETFERLLGLLSSEQHAGLSVERIIIRKHALADKKHKEKEEEEEEEEKRRKRRRRRGSGFRWTRTVRVFLTSVSTSCLRCERSPVLRSLDSLVAILQSLLSAPGGAGSSTCMRLGGAAYLFSSFFSWACLCSR
jgi:hypothetical protein